LIRTSPYSKITGLATFTRHILQEKRATSFSLLVIILVVIIIFVVVIFVVIAILAFVFVVIIFFVAIFFAVFIFIVVVAIFVVIAILAFMFGVFVFILVIGITFGACPYHTTFLTFSAVSFAFLDFLAFSAVPFMFIADPLAFVALSFLAAVSFAFSAFYSVSSLAFVKLPSETSFSFFGTGSSSGFRLSSFCGHPSLLPDFVQCPPQLLILDTKLVELFFQSLDVHGKLMKAFLHMLKPFGEGLFQLFSRLLQPMLQGFL
jgi:hypothetical protein